MLFLAMKIWYFKERPSFLLEESLCKEDQLLFVFCQKISGSLVGLVQQAVDLFIRQLE